MPLFRELHLVRVALQICSVVPDDEGVLVPREPVLHLELKQAMLVEVEIYRMMHGMPTTHGRRGNLVPDLGLLACPRHAIVLHIEPVLADNLLELKRKKLVWQSLTWQMYRM